MGRGPEIGPRGLRRAAAAAAIHLLYRILRLLPRGMGRILCQGLGRAAWYLDPGGRRTSLSNIRTAFGDRLDPKRRRDIGRSAYINLAANLPDLAHLPRLSEEEVGALVSAGRQTLSQIDRAVRGGRGIILLTPHLGNWELLTAYLASRGAPVHFLGREPYDERLDPLYEEVRTSHGGSWVRRGGAFERIQALLNGGEMVILLLDQDTSRVRGTFVEFFGRPAWTPTGPAALARRTGAVMLPGALVRQPDHTYRLQIEPPIRTVSTTDHEYDDWENTRRATLAMERLIERYPAQWVWFHRRWRTRPSEEWTAPDPPPSGGLQGIRSPGER
ncbi:MAG: lysophospholipid acyltransferase family protein [bacterium]